MISPNFPPLPQLHPHKANKRKHQCKASYVDANIMTFLLIALLVKPFKLMGGKNIGFMPLFAIVADICSLTYGNMSAGELFLYTHLYPIFSSPLATEGRNQRICF